jgi:hypothetical protein
MGTAESTAIVLAILVVVAVLFFIAERRLQKKDKDRHNASRTDDDM